ncbi:MAG: hypothetical protein KC456_00830 [Flavobacteriales bacterium]|nr:hypothetical protein [Flavobacteriales bacterium]
MTRILSIFFLFAVTSMTCQSQSINSPIENRAYYRTHNAGTVFMHTRGIGLSFQRGWRTSGFSNRVINFELLTLRHPKEYKVTNPAAQNSRGYFYGKLNSVGLLRASFGWQKTVFDKVVKRGVRVSYFTLIGPTIGMAKPVYVDLKPPSGEGGSTQIVRYTTDVHNQGVVQGRAPMLYKLGTTKIYPGGHARFILNFEYSGDDSMIKAIETGVNLDVFAKKIPIMEHTYNDQFYLTLFIGFQFGKRYI